ncbi:MAG: phosphate/phosphite/phosphonate ABC transporter substrate-binding protein, partial [Gammaproteobacteria bacterium]|nr:phosphate/phosphite/phosphonate ABC transporter substrate-binding protein [Gammaproteobacteria bacterium]MDX5374977.1 phosphate/phosphite/phosphonate ABC transporter substrate-binding protein [Gammaproteobacteria bacterium]
MILHTFIGRLGLALLLIGSLLPALAAAEPPEQRPLRLGVLSLAPPAQTHTDWQPFADYLGDRLGRRISIVVPRGFEAMRDAIKAGELDFFYINGHIHYRLKQSGHSVAVLQMI